MVIPRSRSALSLSRTQAYLKEPLPSSAASSVFCQHALQNLVFWWGCKNCGVAKIVPCPSASLPLTTKAEVTERQVVSKK